MPRCPKCEKMVDELFDLGKLWYCRECHPDKTIRKFDPKGTVVNRTIVKQGRGTIIGRSY